MFNFKVNIKFILLAVVSFIFSYYQGESVFYYISYTFIITFIFGVIFIITQAKNMEVNTDLKKSSYLVGDSEELTISIKNNSVFPYFSLLLKNEGLAELSENYKGNSVYLGAEKTINVNNSLKFRIRGIYEIGNNIIAFNDLFYIFKIKRCFKNQNNVVVYPKILDIDKNFKDNVKLFARSKKSVRYNEDLYNVNDIRKYVSGDNLKRINWKVSARHGELFVKNYDTSLEEENTLFLNMNMENFEQDRLGLQEEFLIDSCVSIVNYAVSKNIKSRIFINHINLQDFYITNEKDLRDLSEFFVRNKSMGNEDFMNCINYNIEATTQISRIGIMCIKVTERYSENILRLSDRGYNISLFYLSEESGNYDINFLKNAGVECINLKQLLH